MRKDNHGFTVIEVLVVIAIIVILTTGIALGLNSVTSANVNKATKTVDAQMKKLRFTTLSKEENYSLYIYKKGSFYYCEIAPTNTSYTNLKSGVKLGKKGMEVQYSEVGNDSFKTVNGSKYIEIAYNRSNGTFKNNENYTKIKFEAGAKSKVIILANSTGRHFIR
jgi:prepilin-type N-terminal cleavage/methylation domain-containing protein